MIERNDIKSSIIKGIIDTINKIYRRESIDEDIVYVSVLEKIVCVWHKIQKEVEELHEEANGIKRNLCMICKNI